MAAKKNGNPPPAQQSGKLEKLGALWLGKSARGVSYMSGVVTIDGTDHRVVVFKNGFKRESKHPDYVIYASEPQETQAPAAKGTEEEIPF
jgi:hypothetical protein